MQMIFSYGLATDKFAKGSGDPLGAQSDFSKTQESETIILDEIAGVELEQVVELEGRGRGELSTTTRSRSFRA